MANIPGTPDDDELFGTPFDDTITGLAGNDQRFEHHGRGFHPMKSLLTLPSRSDRRPKGRASLGVAVVTAAVVHFLSGDPVVAAEESTTPTIQPLERPDAAIVTVPNLEFTPKPADIRGYESYFYFHKAGVSYETAFADLDQCRIYAVTTVFGLPGPPKFAPLGANIVAAAQPRAPVNLDPTYRYGIGGVIGTAIVYALIVVPAEREFDMQMNARCMAYKGYGRYGTTRSIWNQINSGRDAEKLAKLALIASGPQPTAGAIAP